MSPERPRGKRVRNAVSADLWWEEQAEAERARQATRIVLGASVTLKGVRLPEGALKAALEAIGGSTVSNFQALYSEDGTVDVCDVTLDGVGLTEASLHTWLSTIGDVAHLSCMFADEAT